MTTSHRILLLASSIVAALALGGCTLRAGPPVVTGGVTVESAPIDVDVYPHVYYDGQWVYLVGDRWYHRGAHGWIVVGREPAALYHHRLYYRQHRRFEGPAVRHERRDDRHQRPDIRHERRDDRHERRDDRHHGHGH